MRRFQEQYLRLIKIHLRKVVYAKSGSSWNLLPPSYYASACCFGLFLHWLGGVEDDLVLLLIHIHLDGCAILEFAAEQFHRKRTLDILLDGPAQRTGAEGRIIAFLGQPLAGGIGQFER